MQLTKGGLAAKDPSHKESEPGPSRERENTQIAQSDEKPAPPAIPPQSASAPKPNSPDLALNHLAGKVFKIVSRFGHTHSSIFGGHKGWDKI